MRFFDGITDFIFVEDAPQKADLIFIPGGSYPDAARHAAELYHAGYAPLLLPSGKYSITVGRFTAPDTEIFAGSAAEECGKTDSVEEQRGDVRENANGADETLSSYETECDYLCAVLRQCGVPGQAMIREAEATFTWENAIFSRKRTDALSISVRRAILCCQAFHARRCLMYYQEQFPETEFLVCPVVTRGIARDTWYRSRDGIETVLGEVERCGAQFHTILAAHAGLLQEPQAEDESTG